MVRVAFIEFVILASVGMLLFGAQLRQTFGFTSSKRPMPPSNKDPELARAPSKT